MGRSVALHKSRLHLRGSGSTSGAGAAAGTRRLRDVRWRVGMAGRRRLAGHGGNPAHAARVDVRERAGHTRVGTRSRQGAMVATDAPDSQSLRRGRSGKHRRGCERCVRGPDGTTLRHGMTGNHADGLWARNSLRTLGHTLEAGQSPPDPVSQPLPCRVHRSNPAGAGRGARGVGPPAAEIAPRQTRID